jgi:hypothetical protein
LQTALFIFLEPGNQGQREILFFVSEKPRQIVCVQDGDVNSGVGTDWYGRRSGARHYKKLLHTKTSVFFKFRSVALSALVTLFLGLQQNVVILTVSCNASNEIPISTYTRIHIAVLEPIKIRQKFKIKRNS